MSFTEHVCANRNGRPKTSSARPHHRKLRHRGWVNRSEPLSGWDKEVLRRSQWLRQNIGIVRGLREQRAIDWLAGRDS